MTRVDWDTVAPLCEGCGDPMSAIAQDHGEEQFGHQGRCCACYEQSQVGALQRTKRKRMRGMHR